MTMQKYKYKGILFDMDGVLVDSMPAHVDSWIKVFRDYGVEVDSKEIYLREGEKALTTAILLGKKYDLNLSDAECEELISVKRKYYAENASTELIPKAKKLLHSLKDEGFKLGLVTGSIMSNLERIMSAGEKALFDAIMTSDIVTNAKPSPEPYARACDGLGIKRSECLIIENAPLGIQSGRAAGITIAALTSTLSADELNGADFIIDDLEQIWYILKENAG